MASEKNITMKEFNGTDYDTLYPKTKIEQVIGFDNYFTKNQTLSSDTAKLFGLSGEQVIPDNLFNQLFYTINGSNQTIYRWSRWKFIEKKTPLSSDFVYGDDSTVLFTCYANSYKIKKNGEVKLNSPTRRGFSRSNTPLKTKIGLNSYTSSFENYESGVVYNNVKYYFGSNASWTFSATSKNRFRNFTDIYTVSFTKVVEIVTSTNPNAYVVSDQPDSEGWYYEKQPDISLSSPLSKYQILTYQGVNVYGSNNPNKLEFDFTPKLLIISQHAVNSIAWLVNPSTVNSGLIGNTNQSLQTTWGDKTVSWYSTTSASNQFNGNNLIYDCIALG